MSEVKHFFKFKNHLYFLVCDFFLLIYRASSILRMIALCQFIGYKYIFSVYHLSSDFMFLPGRKFWFSWSQICGYFLLWLLGFAYTQRDISHSDIVTLQFCLILCSWKICMHVNTWKVLFLLKFSFLYCEAIYKIRNKSSFLMWQTQ